MENTDCYKYITVMGLKSTFEESLHNLSRYLFG